MNRIEINRAIYKIIMAKIEDLLNKGITEYSKEYYCRISSFTNRITMTESVDAEEEFGVLDYDLIDCEVIEEMINTHNKLLPFSNETMTIKNVWLEQSREFEDVYEITYSIEI